MSDKLKPLDFLSNTNCSYTTSGGVNVKMSFDELLDVISRMPQVPTILTIDISVFRNDLLPENYILLSKNVADALEDAMKARGEE